MGTRRDRRRSADARHGARVARRAAHSAPGARGQQGELEVARLQLERANAIIDYSTQYSIAADLAAAIYDVALSEGSTPDSRSGWSRSSRGSPLNAKSKAGALGSPRCCPARRGCTSRGSPTSSSSTARRTCASGSGTCGTCWSATTATCVARCSPTTVGQAGSRSCSTAGQDPRNGYSTDGPEGIAKRVTADGQVPGLANEKGPRHIAAPIRLS